MSRAKLITVAAGVIHLAAFVLMLRGVEPFYSQFYIFAWWSFIVFLGGINHFLGRNSLVFDDPREAFRVFLFSAPFWLFFEIFNFRLDNWNYIGVQHSVFIRWPGYFLAFGTVLPGIFEVATFLKNVGIALRVRGRGIRITSSLLMRFVALGVVMIIGTLLAPHWMFPFLWLGLTFILDPILYRTEAREESFSRQAEKGDYSLLVRLLLAGLVCGVLWEFWNFWAGSKWVYSVPRLDFLKIFEMPILGYFGFPPFALECYLAYRLFVLFRQRYLDRTLAVKVGVVVFGIIYCIAVFRGIDRYTVWTFRL
jgi:hypothetical protein